MKAIQVVRCGKPEVMEYNDIPDPLYEKDQVLIEVRGTSVNYADIKARSGVYHLAKTPPFTPGLDVSGIVLETGSEVTGIKPGDHVIAFPATGSYAEKAVASHHLTFVIPKDLDFIKASGAGLVTGTVVHMLRQIAAVEEGENLLIHAAGGGVGTTALQVAKAFGVSEIFASIGSMWKESHVREMGANHIIDYNQEDYGQKILELTGGKGVDVIMNPLGGPTLERDMQCLAPFGRLVLFGEMKGDSAILPIGSLYSRNRSIYGCSFGHYRRFRPERVRDTMKIAIDLLAQGKIDIHVHSCMPMEQASEAHQLLEDRKAVGKIILVPEKFYRQDS